MGAQPAQAHNVVVRACGRSRRRGARVHERLASGRGAPSPNPNCPCCHARLPHAPRKPPQPLASNLAPTMASGGGACRPASALRPHPPPTCVQVHFHLHEAARLLDCHRRLAVPGGIYRALCTTGGGGRAHVIGSGDGRAAPAPPQQVVPSPEPSPRNLPHTSSRKSTISTGTCGWNQAVGCRWQRTAKHQELKPPRAAWLMHAPAAWHAMPHSHPAPAHSPYIDGQGSTQR